MIGKRAEIINFLIKNNNYSKYLEIGIGDPTKNFDKIRIPRKDGVDPYVTPKLGNSIMTLEWSSVIHKMTSDNYFAHSGDQKWDIIFVDGLHLGEQVATDLYNTATRLTPNGTIVVHDCSPPTEWHTRPYDQFLQDHSTWNGTTYKGFIAFKQANPDLEIETVDTDWGCGIIRNPKNVAITKLTAEQVNQITWQQLADNRKTLLNLITPEQFEQKYGPPTPKVGFVRKLLSKISW